MSPEVTFFVTFYFRVHCTLCLRSELEMLLVRTVNRMIFNNDLSYLVALNDHRSLILIHLHLLLTPLLPSSSSWNRQPTFLSSNLFRGSLWSGCRLPCNAHCSACLTMHSSLLLRIYLSRSSVYLCLRPGCPSVRPWQCGHTSSLLTHLANRSSEFHKIYNLRAVQDRDELIRFWGQKVKGQGHSETTYGQISTLEGILCSLSWNARPYLNDTYQNYSLLSYLDCYRSTWFLWHLQGHKFKGHCHRQHFTTMRFSRWRYISHRRVNVEAEA